MERAKAIETGLDLELAEEDLHSPVRESPPCLRSEYRCRWINGRATLKLVCPELLELRLESVRQELIACAPALGDLGPEPDSDSRPSA
jgi:hypothetical protein